MEFREVYNRLDKCKKNTVNIVDVLCLFSDIIDSISRERSVPAAKIPLGEIEDIAGLWAKTARFLTDVYNINEKEMNKDQDEFPDLVEMQKRDRDTLLNLYQLIEDAQKAKKDHENDLNDIINEQKQLNDLKTENDNYINQVTYSPAYASLRGGGFSLKYGNPYSINELTPCVPRL